LEYILNEILKPVILTGLVVLVLSHPIISGDDQYIMCYKF